MEYHYHVLLHIQIWTQFASRFLCCIFCKEFLKTGFKKNFTINKGVSNHYYETKIIFLDRFQSAVLQQQQNE